MESKLTGTAALLIGASSGIGAAVTRRLADHGASVALLARRALPEAITHLAVSAGWPKAVSAAAVAKQVFRADID